MKIKKLLVLCVMGLAFLMQRQAMADVEESIAREAAEGTAEEVVVEVLRGEEAEVELLMPGTEEIYTLFGVLTGDAAYAPLLTPQERIMQGYQAMEIGESGGEAKLLLSRLGMPDGEGLRIRLRVEGKRIGSTVLKLTVPQYVSKESTWMEEAAFPEIEVRVLPNPILISVSGTKGNADWFVKEASVTIKDKDAAKIYYTLDGQAEKEYTGKFEVTDGVWTLQVRTDDGYGYIKEETEQIYVDGEKPVLSASPAEAGWQNGTIELVLGATDAISGIAEAHWTVSESETTTEDGKSLSEEMTHRIEEDGIWYVHLWARDVAGNEAETVFGPYQKDSVAPEILIENIAQDEIITNGVVPAISFADFSGVAQTEYYLDGEAWEVSEITGRGEHTLTVVAVDLAGNRAEKTVTFFIYDSLEVSCTTKDRRYSDMTIFVATAAYRETPLTDREIVFYVNGDPVGTAMTDRNGKAVLAFPVDLAPQEAVLTAEVAQDDTLYYAETKAECTFTVEPEYAVALYTGDWVVKNGDTLAMRVETAEVPDERIGDITKAKLLAELFYIEEDGSRSVVGEWQLSPDENGMVFWEGTYETGLYELNVTFAEGSYYEGNPVKLYLAVYDIQAEYADGLGSLLIDLPNVGLRMQANLQLLPTPDFTAEATLRIPGTGIVLTENDIEGWNLTTEGLVLNGRAQHPETGEVYRYQLKAKFSTGILITELEASVWEGEEPTDGSTEEPVYQFQWELEDLRG